MDESPWQAVEFLQCTEPKLVIALSGNKPCETGVSRYRGASDGRGDFSWYRTSRLSVTLTRDS